jgi:hypothetical protein
MSKDFENLDALIEKIAGNISFQRETTSIIEENLLKIFGDFKDDLKNRESDLGKLEYISRDIKDNFEFTNSIFDEINSIKDLVSQINLLSLNTILEVSKLEESGDIINMAREIRDRVEKSEKVLERVFTKEVKNKSFSQHNLYIKNSILPLIDKRVESLGDYLGRGDELRKDIKRNIELINELGVSNSGILPLLSILSDLARAGENCEKCEPESHLESKIVDEVIEVKKDVKKISSEKVIKPIFSAQKSEVPTSSEVKRVVSKF